MSSPEDELALAQLMARYVDGANRRDEDTWAATWAEDASWDLMGTQVSGRANIVGLWQQMLAGFEFAIMMPNSHLFDVSGSTASGHWYLHEYTRDLKGNGATLLSRYQDTYCKIDGQWLYQSRRYSILYHGPGKLDGNYMAPTD